MQKHIKISIIIPVMNESGNIENIVKKLSASMNIQKLWEVVFVDDGSSDGTLDKLKEESKKDQRIKYVSFSRNFGHQNALRAGYDYADGDCVICMDGDMQHPPELIPQMIKKWQEGYDIVYTIRNEDPNLSFMKRRTAQIFYKLMNLLSDIKIEAGAADFRLIDRNVLDAIRKIKENDLFMRGMISWIGYKQYGLHYDPEERCWGETKYTYRQMFKFAMSGITSFSVRPLHISTILGYTIALLSFIYAAYAIIMRLFTETAIAGWTSVLVGVMFIGGVQMVMIGILGGYIGRIFLESKKRPNYIIKEENIK